jgi:parallel beta-helix repeat protein
MRRRDIGKLLAACAVAPSLVPWRAWSQSCAAAEHAKTPAESAAGVEITDSSRCPGDWRRYGADPTGQADSAAAIQAACSANTLAFDATGGNYRVASSIKIPSGVTVRGAGVDKTLVSCPNGDISIFLVANGTGVTVERIKFETTATSAKAHTGAVEFHQSTRCACKECEIVGCNWAGVLLHDSTYCTVDGCHFHDFQGAVQDSANVLIYNQSHHNSVTNNKCFGGNWHGIAIQDPYNNSLPANNVVANNLVGQHKAYGIMVYVPTAGDTSNQVTGNSVHDIQGSVLDNNSGAGIYVVGAGSGGTAVTDNTVRNCCVQTKQASLAPAGIGIGGISQNAAPVTVSGNDVGEMRAHDAILIVSSKGRITVSGNKAALAAGNRASPIRLDASSHVAVTGNTTVRDPSTDGRCIFVHANAIAITDISVTGNTCYAGAYPGIEFLPTSGGSISNVLCTNNVVKGPGVNSDCIRLVAVNGASVSDNKCISGS